MEEWHKILVPEEIARNMNLSDEKLDTEIKAEEELFEEMFDEDIIMWE